MLKIIGSYTHDRPSYTTAYPPARPNPPSTRHHPRPSHPPTPLGPISAVRKAQTGRSGPAQAGLLPRCITTVVAKRLAPSRAGDRERNLEAARGECGGRRGRNSEAEPIVPRLTVQIYPAQLYHDMHWCSVLDAWCQVYATGDSTNEWGGPRPILVLVGSVLVLVIILEVELVLGLCCRTLASRREPGLGVPTLRVGATRAVQQNLLACGADLAL